MQPTQQITRLFKTAIQQNQKTRCIMTISKDIFKVEDQKDFVHRVMNSKVPVIVDFFADWCRPCKKLEPVVESLIAQKEGRVVLAKVDIDQNADLALDYDVGAIPVLLAMRNGKVEERLVGLQDCEKVKQFVEKFCGDDNKTPKDGRDISKSASGDSK